MLYTTPGGTAEKKIKKNFVITIMMTEDEVGRLNISTSTNEMIDIGDALFMLDHARETVTGAYLNNRRESLKKEK